MTESGYDEPTAIQAGAIPSVLMMRDMIGIAQTGTGKTASFVLPMIDILAHGRARALMPRSLILEPTRELAAQVAENFEKYGKYHKLSMALLIGGETMDEQIKLLDKRPDYLIDEGVVRLRGRTPGDGHVELACLGPGETVGEFSLLDGGPRSASAVADTAVSGWRIGRERFAALSASGDAAAQRSTCRSAMRVPGASAP